MSEREKAISYLDDLDNRLEALIQKVSVLHMGHLNVQPENGGWSILQILDHLRQSEALCLRYIKYKIDNKAVFPRAGMRASIRSYILNKRLRSPRKMKAPNLNGLSPKHSEVNFEKTTSDWLQNRKDLRELLSSIDESLYKKAVYKHPGLGKLSIRQMLSFYSVHFDRHLKQLNNVIKQVTQ